jgi:hypothetical protein
MLTRLLTCRFRAATPFFVLAATVAAFVALAPILSGCGGGGGKASSTRSATPTQVTRDRVHTLHTSAFRTSVLTGYQPMTLARGLNGEDMASGGGGSGAAFPPVPMVGAFLRNVAAAPVPTRAAHLARARRGEPTPSPTASPADMPPQPPPPPDPQPTFYFDYYLGLWVEIADSPGSSTYTLYEDEAKTKPAGTIATVWPTDWEQYPQVFKSTYTFTAGYLAGSHGSSENVTNVDGSGRATYEDVYTDGWKHRGSSSWSGRGDYSYQSRTETSSAQWTESRGSFRSDGRGGARYATSDGYTADYVYAADGSGHGTITGPDPGLPVTISWDAYGNTTIRYADGTIERMPGWGMWGYGGGGGGPMPDDTAVSPSTGTTSPSG